MIDVVSQLPAVIWPSMTLMLALLVLCLAQIGSMRLGALANLPGVNSYGRGMFGIDKCKCAVLGVDHES